MFQPRARDFEPRIDAIVSHLRAIEGELGRIGRTAGEGASAGITAAGDQIADVIGPILREIRQRFGGRAQAAVDDAMDYGSDALQTGARLGSEALSRLARGAKERPLITVAVAIGIGMLIGLAGRGSWDGAEAPPPRKRPRRRS
jgi:ElaB/YqjD/DUF883 family membrane-anchored ribosome-binding protein